MAKKKKKKNSNLFEKSKKDKKKKKKKNKIAEYDFLLVDFWDDDPESQLSTYQEIMYNRNYSKWKSKMSKKKKQILKMREHPAKYYRQRQSMGLDNSKIKKSSGYKKYKQRRNEKFDDDVINTALKIGGIAVNLLMIGSKTGLIKSIFGKNAAKNANVILSIIKSFV